MKPTRIKLMLAGPLALFALLVTAFPLRADLLLEITPSGTNALLTWTNSAAT